MKNDKLNQTQIAALAGVSTRTLREWRDREGLDITDQAQVLKRAALAPSKETGEAARARLRKLNADAAMQEHRLEVQRGNYMRREEAYSEAHLVGLHIQQMLYYKMPSELTPRLVGRSSAEIADELQAFARETLTLLHEKGYMDRVVQEVRCI